MHLAMLSPVETSTSEISSFVVLDFLNWSCLQLAFSCEFLMLPSWRLFYQNSDPSLDDGSVSVGNTRQRSTPWRWSDVSCACKGLSGH